MRGLFAAKGVLKYCPKYDNEVYVWTAGRRVIKTGSKFFWKTRSGIEHMRFTNWMKGQPNGRYRNEACVSMSTQPWYHWFDSNCNIKMCFICQTVKKVRYY